MDESVGDDVIDREEGINWVNDYNMGSCQSLKVDNCTFVEELNRK